MTVNMTSTSQFWSHMYSHMSLKKNDFSVFNPTTSGEHSCNMRPINFISTKNNFSFLLKKVHNGNSVY